MNRLRQVGSQVASLRILAASQAAAASAVVVVVVVLLLVASVVAACSSGEGAAGSTASSTPSGSGGQGMAEGPRTAGDVEGRVGEDLEVGDAVVTVRALQATFQPADPVQRLSAETPVAPADGESFYQAFVRVLNTGVTPLRIDPRDFTMAIGGRVVAVEPTRSGPAARSLLHGASLDLLLTFKGEAGREPVLLYDPEWYDGTIRVGLEAGTTTTTE